MQPKPAPGPPIGNNQKEIIDGDSMRRPKGTIQGVQNQGENLQGSCVAFAQYVF
jgi:hypothetical protein